MRPPNVLLVTTHDSGRHFGCYGVPTVRTPAIDRIAADGMRMSNCFATVPICGASRACMLTGQYPQTNGQLDLPAFGYDLHEPRAHLSHRLREHGYETHLFHFQHEVRDTNRLAFDAIHDRQKKRVNADLVAEDVAAFLASRSEDDAPFYAQVNFFESHSPFAFGDIEPDHTRGVYVPPYLKPTGPAYELLADLQGAMKRIDDAVAAIDAALHRAGIAENTLLIVTTDHGVELPRAKWHLHDQGIEIALAARWPAGGIVGGHVCDWLASNLDFTPTLLELIGASPAPDVQGVSLATGWRGEGGAGPNEHICGYFLKRARRSVRTNRHKLICNFMVTPLAQPPVDIADPSAGSRVIPTVELYDLDADPLERRNLADDAGHAEVRADLMDRLWRWLEAVDDEILAGPLRMPIYEQAIGEYERWRQHAQSASTTAHQRNG